MTSIQFVAGTATLARAVAILPLPAAVRATYLRPHHTNSRIPKNTTAYIATGTSSHNQSIAGLQ